MYNETMAKIACAIIFVGFNVTFLPQFVMGSQGMPRRYFNYIEQFQPFHQVSTIGSFILGLGFLMVFYYLVKSLFGGQKATANPWGSRALEWQINTRPPLHNFHHTPVIINGPYDYHKPMEEFQLGLAASGNGHGQYHDIEVESDGKEINAE